MSDLFRCDHADDPKCPEKRCGHKKPHEFGNVRVRWGDCADVGLRCNGRNGNQLFLTRCGLMMDAGCVPVGKEKP